MEIPSPVEIVQIKQAIELKDEYINAILEELKEPWSLQECQDGRVVRVITHYKKFYEEGANFEQLKRETMFAFNEKGWSTEVADRSQGIKFAPAKMRVHRQAVGGPAT